MGLSRGGLQKFHIYCKPSLPIVDLVCCLSSHIQKNFHLLISFVPSFWNHFFLLPIVTLNLVNKCIDRSLCHISKTWRNDWKANINPVLFVVDVCWLFSSFANIEFFGINFSLKNFWNIYDWTGSFMYQLILAYSNNLRKLINFKLW